MKTVDGYLSRKAQVLNPAALVVKVTGPDGSEAWYLEERDEEPIGLGPSYGRALQAIHAMRAARRAASVQTTCQLCGDEIDHLAGSPPRGVCFACGPRPTTEKA